MIRFAALPSFSCGKQRETSKQRETRPSNCSLRLSLCKRNISVKTILLCLPKHEIAQLRGAAGRALPIGARVHIRGLISKPELNGQPGIVLLFDRAKARYAVRLADEQKILLKPECLDWDVSR